MLHTKFRENRQSGSGKEDFEWFSPYMGMAAILGHVTSIISTNFHFHVPKSLHTKFGLKRSSGFWEKHVLIFIHQWHWAKVKK